MECRFDCAAEIYIEVYALLYSTHYQQDLVPFFTASLTSARCSHPPTCRDAHAKPINSPKNSHRDDQSYLHLIVNRIYEQTLRVHNFKYAVCVCVCSLRAARPCARPTYVMHILYIVEDLGASMNIPYITHILQPLT